MWLGSVTEPGRGDDLDRGRRRRHTLVWLSGLSMVLIATVVVAVGIGPVAIGPGTVAQIVGHHVLGWPDVVTWQGTDDTIVWLVRLPRVVLGAVVGAALAVTGMALQAMVRNVLADPYILGVTSGASTGAAAVILFGVGAGLGALGISALSVSAFLGALGAMVAVFLIARSGGTVTSVRLLLAGIAVGYALYAATSFLIFASDSPEGARSVLYWLLGSLTLAGWSGSLAIACVAVAVTLAVLTMRGRHLDALAIGDETAHTLGVSPARFRVQLLVVVALCVGAVVAVSGGIGFVGLVVPHLARKVIGGAHQRAIPVAALIGAIFLVWADVVARTALAPQELPIGIVTSLIGAPFLLILVRRFHAAAT
ncbi:MAG: FecCD family ABC transporter permease [Pseudonocardiaceae bacterium]